MGYCVVEAVFEFVVYSMFFFSILNDERGEMELNAKSISIFASTYLIFCLPYKAFCSIVLYQFAIYDTTDYTDFSSEHFYSDKSKQ